MKLTIKIKLDNAAFDNPCEIGRILNEVTENINNFRIAKDIDQIYLIDNSELSSVFMLFLTE